MELNLDTKIFEGLNSKEGIMLCGYEWGGSGSEDLFKRNQGPFTKNNYKYANRIKTWFELWGHKIDKGGAFDKTLLQTNWCNTRSREIEGNYLDKLLADEQVENFIYHIYSFKPRLLIFFGSVMIKILQNKKVLPRFMEIMGRKETEPLEVKRNSSFHGKKFKVSFQSFEKCNVISLPHPSGSRGLKDEYIELFAECIGPKIQEVKRLKNI